MSEAERMVSVESGPGTPSSPQTAGQWLRAARQQRGLHIAALAAALKVPQAKLEALEADRHADLPDATFARALAKAVCRTLKVDAAPVMALLPRGDDHELHVSLGINAPYRERGNNSEGVSLAALQRPIVWAPLLLLLGAAGLYLMPSHWLEREFAPAPVAASAPVVEMASSVPQPAASQAVETTTASAAQPPLEQPSPASVSSASAASAVPAVVASPIATTPKPGSAPAATAGQLALSLKTTSDSWVEVVDASGQTLISRIIPAGEHAELSGAAPLKVKIGNVAGTELTLRGKPVDLQSQSKDNVARLELN